MSPQTVRSRTQLSANGVRLVIVFYVITGIRMVEMFQMIVGARAVEKNRVVNSPLSVLDPCFASCDFSVLDLRITAPPTVNRATPATVIWIRETSSTATLGTSGVSLGSCISGANTRGRCVRAVTSQHLKGCPDYNRCGHSKSCLFPEKAVSPMCFFASAAVYSGSVRGSAAAIFSAACVYLPSASESFTRM